MGYCSIIDVQNTIAQALTSSTDTSSTLDTVGNLINIGNTFNRNLVTNDIVSYYIQMADRVTDATLSQLYATPFCELSDFETILFSGIDEYNPYIVIERPCPLTTGDTVVLIDGNMDERHEIEDVIAPTIFATLEPIGYEFAAGTRIVRVSYPDPIRWISARVAAATIYDKYFSAESSPNTSNFGKYLREMARRETNNILQGRTIIHGQHRIGRRFYNPNLDDQYGLPKGSEGAKDIDNLTQ